jgi:hypothetical protein
VLDAAIAVGMQNRGGEAATLGCGAHVGPVNEKPVQHPLNGLLGRLP